MMKLCPNCGTDICKDEAITIGPISMVPYGEVQWHGNRVRLTAGESAVLWTILKANGVPVSRPAIAERMGHEGENPENSISVHLSAIRRKLSEVGPMPPIKSIRYIGVKWSELEAA